MIYNAVSVSSVQQSGSVIHTLGWPKSLSGDFPGDSVIENPPAGDTGSIPGPERFHMSQSN